MTQSPAASAATATAPVPIIIHERVRAETAGHDADVLSITGGVGATGGGEAIGGAGTIGEADTLEGAGSDAGRSTMVAAGGGAARFDPEAAAPVTALAVDTRRVPESRRRRCRSALRSAAVW
jgi:hypothetical protein